MTKRQTLKDDIVEVVLRSGIAIRADKIANRVILPDDVQLQTLLDELVSEGRLVASFTLLTNGEPSRLYNLHPKAMG